MREFKIESEDWRFEGWPGVVPGEVDADTGEAVGEPSPTVTVRLSRWADDDEFQLEVRALMFEPEARALAQGILDCLPTPAPSEAMIAHILLLPHESTRAALLAPGAPVWIPAGLGEDAEFGWSVGRDVPQSDGVGEGAEHLECVPVAWASVGVGHADPAMLHLVLARDGAVVPEGSDRLARVSPATGPMADRLIRRLLGESVWGVRTDYAMHLLSLAGTLLLLDADGREVAS